MEISKSKYFKEGSNEGDGYELDEFDYKVHVEEGEDKPEARSKLKKALKNAFPDIKTKSRVEVRREAAKDPAEFLAVKKSGTKVKSSLNKLLQSVKDSGEEKTLTKVTKLVKAPVEKDIKTLETPLERPEALRTQRTVLYNKAKRDVSRWNAIVYHNRMADQMVYPLNAGKRIPKLTAADKAKDFVPMTPLEEEMAKILYGEEYVKQKQAELKKEREGPTDQEAYMLSVEEAMSIHSEMARLRAVQSYEMAKAKRRNKIKSKKYHRLLRKEKIRKQLKDFEELQKTDPEAAMEKLHELDQSRVEERMSLKHRNTSKWAKMQAARAKYNKESRIALSEQLHISKELTKKVQESSDEEDDLETDIPLLVRSSMENPWMLRPEVKENDKLHLYYSGYKKLWEEINAKKAKEVEKDRKEEAKTTAVKNSSTKSTANSKKLFQVVDDGLVEIKDELDFADEVYSSGDDDDEVIEMKEKVITEGSLAPTSAKKRKSKSQIKKKVKKPKNTKAMTEDAEVQDEESMLHDMENMIQEAEYKVNEDSLRTLRKLQKAEKLRKKALVKEKQHLLKLELRKGLKLKNRKSKAGDADEIRELEVTNEDQLLESNSSTPQPTSSVKLISFGKKSPSSTPTEPQQEVKTINPENFLKISKSKGNSGDAVAKFNGSGLKGVDFEDDEDADSNGSDEDGDGESQRKIIAEAFQDDDVVNEFKRRKNEEVESSKPKDLDLFLPGWGEWAGKGIKPRKKSKKRQQFLIKAPAKPPRKDARLSHVILNEEAGEKMKEHQVRELPFPFTRVKDFEKSIRAPVGRTWMPEKAVKTLVAPKVITRLGAIIQPIDEDVLVKTGEAAAKDLKVPKSIKQLKARTKVTKAT